MNEVTSAGLTRSVTEGRRIDVHAHFFAAATPSGAERRFPSLQIDSDGAAGRIMIGDDVFRHVRPALWDIDARLVELDAAGIDVQVVSPVPATLEPAGPVAEVAAYLRAQNDLLAAAVAGTQGRLLAFGAVPLGQPEAAAEEVVRLARSRGIVGVEIGTTGAGHELDDPSFEPFFAAAEEHDMPLFVHPTGQQAAIRRTGPPYTFGLGMHTDTGLAGAALVFGGVLERFPRLRVALAHGCGSLPWSFPRLTYAVASTKPERRPPEELLRRLWADTLVFDPVHLDLLVRRFGADHLVLGTDHPFYPSPLLELVGIVEQAEVAGVLDAQQVRSIRGENAGAFLPPWSGVRSMAEGDSA